LQRHRILRHPIFLLRRKWSHLHAEYVQDGIQDEVLHGEDQVVRRPSRQLLRRHHDFSRYFLTVYCSELFIYLNNNNMVQLLRPTTTLNTHAAKMGNVQLEHTKL
jgi:hypothetical protein